MKKLLCIAFSIVFVFCFAGCKNIGEELSEQYLVLELTEVDKTINPSIEFSIVDEEGTVWIEEAHVQRVLVAFEKSKNRYLEIRLNEEGLKNLKKALRKEHTLTIMVDGVALASPVVLEDLEEKSAMVMGEYDNVIEWFNILT